jgi:hypothetical protein
VARLVAAVPEGAAVAPAAVVPEAVAEAVVVAALAVAPVVRTTLPHLCIEAPRPTSPGVLLTSHVSFSRSTNPTQQVFLGAIRICAFKVRRSLRHLRCENLSKSRAEALASGIVSNGQRWGDAWKSTQPAG